MEMSWKIQVKDHDVTKKMEGLLQCSANYVPLSPISFLERASMVYGDQVSIVCGTLKYSWRETHERCLKLASALCHLDISPGDIVAALAPNVPALYELHFGVPMAGAVLAALNPRLDTATVALLLEQLEAKIIFVDYQFIQLVLEAFDILSHVNHNPPLIVLIPDLDPSSSITTINGTPPGNLDYDGLLAMGEVNFVIRGPKNECDPISVNYTSGSTGTPKGVVYSHRAAYLNSLAQVFRSDMRARPVFLWTVDMFRCNGWCLTWAVAALGGTNICLRNLSGKIIFDAISLHNVSHLCGAPILLNMIADCEKIRRLPCRVEIMVAGVLPPAQTLSKIANLGFNITHAYGMTEALGIVVTKLWEPDHDGVLLGHQDKRHNLIMEAADVKDPTTLKSVPSDGKTVGEVMFRGNTMMTGYFKNSKATREAFVGGWFRTGDLGIRHPDGHIQMKDRMRDVIVCGDVTISTIEVESVLVSHPMVLEAAVVGRPDDDQLGEVPCAFVKLKREVGTTPGEIIEFCGGKLPGYMVPRRVVFGDLPVNSTGKIQKFVLREMIKAMGNHAQQSISKYV